MPVEPQQLYLLARPRGSGKYRVEELRFRAGTCPPCEFHFLTDLGDEIIVWSVNLFLSQKDAHEIAIQWGESIGWYV